ncbi:MAG TPA: SDR family NAD(P)-dependent oxidoreductase [Chryseosolibacter sp.]
MGKIFITGSADGLGLLAARKLIELGHEVVLHARNTDRGRDLLKRVKGAETVLIGDLSDIAQTKKLGEEANKTGKFDAVIHNAGVYQVQSQVIFAVNTLAPYILTCLIEPPQRLIYLSSGMHLSGRTNLEAFSLDTNRITYSDSKLHVLMLAFAVARKVPGVFSNAVDPGWVPTKMGGHGAPDDLNKGYETQVWLASSNDESAKVSGKYFHHKKERQHNRLASDQTLQEEFLKRCEAITRISFSARSS